MTISLTGHAEIDRQHALLEHLVDRLESACSKGLAEAQCGGCTPAQVCHCRSTVAELGGEIMAVFSGHVTYEEKLMGLLPPTPECAEHISKHKQSHAGVSNVLSKMIYSVATENPYSVAMSLIQLLANWLGDHQKHFDIPLATQLQRLMLPEASFDHELIHLLDAHVFHDRPMGEIPSARNAKRLSGAELTALRASYDALTPKQREVCLLLVDGTTGKKIAEKLGVSINTLKTHRSEIFRKMNVTSLLELVRKIDALTEAARR